MSKADTRSYPRPSSRESEHRRIVASKVAAPSRRPGIVDRPGLLERLRRFSHVPVVLVSAPAGYAKTTLLGLWAERDERRFAWVSLDATDNDPVALITAILTALDPIVTMEPSIGQRLKAADTQLDEVVLPSLMIACADADDPFVLVLDDAHVVTERRCQTVIGYFAEHVPPKCQIALATRSDPPLPLASWRAHGRLLEFRSVDLALGTAEAAAVLAAADVRLTDTQVSRLVSRAEGWSAALYLAALSLQGRAEPGAFIDSFTGTSRHVADFLSEDVLSRLESDVIEFLLHTCVLDELTASLCDSLAGGGDSQAMLRMLERSNLFVVPLDEDGSTYRYHQLFAQYLRAELSRRDPDIVPEHHRRAYQWYRDHRLFGRAVTHAQACGDVDAAAEMVAAQWLSMVEHGQVDTMRSWLGGFSDAQIEGHAPLAIAAAWVSGFAGERDRAVRFAAAARLGHWDGDMPDGTASLESALAIMCAALGLGGVSGMHAAARRAVELEPPSSPWRTGALVLRGEAEVLEGHFAAARSTLEEAVKLTVGKNATGATSLAYLAFAEMQQGHVEQALLHAQGAHAIVEQPGMAGHMPNISTYSVLANVLSQRGDLKGAAQAVQRANELLPRLTDAYWWQMSFTRILLAPALVALGRDSEAADLLAESTALLASHPDAGKLPEWTERTARTLRLVHTSRQRSAALSDAEQRILRLLDGDLTLREIGRELYISHNTVRTHAHSIYRKLGVSSRAEAVEAARVQRGVRATRDTAPLNTPESVRV